MSVSGWHCLAQGGGAKQQLEGVILLGKDMLESHARCSQNRWVARNSDGLLARSSVWPLASERRGSLSKDFCRKQR